MRAIAVAARPCGLALALVCALSLSPDWLRTEGAPAPRARWGGSRSRLRKSSSPSSPRRSASLPAKRESAYVRCAGAKLMACWVGANLDCGKANVHRSLLGATAYCRDNPGSDSIPMAATGHDTIYDWRCDGKRAVAGKANRAVDAEAISPATGSKYPEAGRPVGREIRLLGFSGFGQHGNSGSIVSVLSTINPASRRTRST